MESFIDILRERFGEDEPILSDEIIAAFPDVSKVTVFNRLNAALEKGNLERFGRGVYFIPREGVLGKVPLLPLKVLKKKYLGEGGIIYGYISGLNLENEVGVSPQVPATLEITTNNASRRVREVEPFGGWRRITLRTPRTKVTKKNVDALRFLDLLTNISLATLDDGELSNLKRLSAGLDRNTVMECIRYYPAKTAKRLLESEAIGVFAR
jgi:predicted transcriptional regulator of viral defense system